MMPGEERTALTGAGTESKRIEPECDRVAPLLHVTPEMKLFGGDMTDTLLKV